MATKTEGGKAEDETDSERSLELSSWDSEAGSEPVSLGSCPRGHKYVLSISPYPHLHVDSFSSSGPFIFLL